jgi:hypothetical protein
MGARAENVRPSGRALVASKNSAAAFTSPSCDVKIIERTSSSMSGKSALIMPTFEEEVATEATKLSQVLTAP